MSKQIFISHSEPDKPLIDALKKLIRNVFDNSVSLHISSEKGKEGVGAGEEWKIWISEKVTESDIVLVVMTPCSVERHWVMTEIGFAQGRDKPIVTMLFGLEKSEIPGSLQDLQAKKGDEKDDVLAVLTKIDSTLKIGQGFRSIDNDINDYLNSVKKIVNQYPKKFTKDELMAMALGPLGLAIKQGMKMIKKK